MLWNASRVLKLWDPKCKWKLKWKSKTFVLWNPGKFKTKLRKILITIAWHSFCHIAHYESVIQNHSIKKFGWKTLWTTALMIKNKKTIWSILSRFSVAVVRKAFQNCLEIVYQELILCSKGANCLLRGCIPLFLKFYLS